MNLIRKIIKGMSLIEFIVGRAVMFAIVGYLYYMLQTDTNISSLTVIHYGWVAMLYYCIWDAVYKISNLKYRLASPLPNEIKVKKDYWIHQSVIPAVKSGNHGNRLESKPISKVEEAAKRIGTVGKATWLKMEGVLTIISHMLSIVVAVMMCFLFFYGIRMSDFSLVTNEGFLSVWFMFSIFSYIVYKLSCHLGEGYSHCILLKRGASRYVISDSFWEGIGKSRIGLSKNKGNMFMDACWYFFVLFFDICKLLSCAFIVVFVCCGLCELWMVYPYMMDVICYFSLLMIAVEMAKTLISEISYEIDKDIIIADSLMCEEKYVFSESDVDKKKLVMSKSERNDKNEHGTV
ncbi:hypothetical protein MKC79_09750 [[Clostridium] innocuum]|nr:hypothetical protein [[Clostridium] innocuum]